MARPPSFTWSFDLSSTSGAFPAYFAGQVLSGKIVLDLTKAKRTTGIEVGCHGRGTVQWTEPASSNKKKGPAPATNNVDRVFAEEVYVDETVKLIDSNEVTKLQPGQHSYPFEFRLPGSGPSSFQGPYGSTKYWLTATFHRPAGKPPHMLKIPFTLNGILDLNLQQGSGPSEARQFMKQSPLSRLISCPFTKAPGIVGFHLKLHRTAYVPGEYVQFRAEVRNWNTAASLPATVTISVVQESRYKVGERSKTGFRQTVCTARGPSVPASQTEIWETNPIDSLFLLIPAIPPTNLATSSIISISYYLQFEMELYGQKNLKAQLPLVIGTIPNRSAFPDLVRSSSSSSPDELIDALSEYPEIARPTFEEAACFTPSSMSFIIPFRSKVSDKTSELSGGTKPLPSVTTEGNNADSAANPDEDSEDEDSASNNDLESYDSTYVPLYAKYLAAYDHHLPNDDTKQPD